MPITFVSSGTNNNGTANVLPGLPANGQTDDFMIMAVESSGINNQPATPTGWTLLETARTGAPTYIADDARMTVFHAWYSSGINRTVVDSGDHTGARIHMFRGVDLTTPIEAWTFSADAANVTSHSHTSPTTLTDGAFVVGCFAIGDDGWTLSALANTSLVSATDTGLSLYASGNDGGHFVAYGEKATAGAVNNWTFTSSLAERSAGIVLALKPAGGGGGGGATHPGWRNAFGGGWF